MKAHKFNFIFIVIVFSSLQLAAQSDFRKGSIITNNGDTVSGLIDYKPDYILHTICLFKFTESDSIHNYKASDIKGFI